MIATGDKVVLEKLEYKHARSYGEIVLPDSFDGTLRMCKAKIKSIGPLASNVNLKVDDIVLYDTFSVFYDTNPLVVTKIENIICLVEEVDD